VSGRTHKRWPRVSTKSVATLLAAGGLSLLACASAPEQITHSPKAQKELAQALAGRTPGRAVDCLYNFPAAKMQVIDDWTILFRNGRTVYVQNPRGGCRGVGIPGNTLVTRQIGINQICSGDIAYLRQLGAGTSQGSCIFGPFVPYTKSN
jgi:hypothetical protein